MSVSGSVEIKKQLINDGQYPDKERISERLEYKAEVLILSVLFAYVFVKTLLRYT
jgi:hypothetical protein